MTRTLPSFEDLQRLAQEQPQALEQLRRQLTDAVIEAAPPRRRQRLRGLQFQISERCRIAPNPLAACVAVSAMMHDTLADLRDLLNGEHPEPRSAHPHGATIVPFRRP